MLNLKIPQKKRRGFGSTNKQGKETYLYYNEGKSCEGLVDKGAHVSIIPLDQWPQQWPKQKAPIGVVGVGTTSEVIHSTMILSCQGPDGQEGTVPPITTHLPVNLWGRDLLQQWGAEISIPLDQYAQ